MMKILLCQDVKQLGWLGDVVDVAQGYATNYLIPQGIAVLPTQTNLKSLAKQKEKRTQQRLLERKRLEELAKAVQEAEAVVAAKANQQGHLFGSVSPNNIAENLRDQGFDVDDQVVQLPQHIKQVGTHPVTLKFAEDLTATINVVVVPIQDNENESASQNREG
jgi:large subunit ribosomal protein L9